MGEGIQQFPGEFKVAANRSQVIGVTRFVEERNDDGVEVRLSGSYVGTHRVEDQSVDGPANDCPDVVIGLSQSQRGVCVEAGLPLRLVDSDMQFCEFAKDLLQPVAA